MLNSDISSAYSDISCAYSDISCTYNDISSVCKVPTNSKLTSAIVHFTRNCVRNELYMAMKDIQKNVNNKPL